MERERSHDGILNKVRLTDSFLKNTTFLEES